MHIFEVFLHYSCTENRVFSEMMQLEVDYSGRKKIALKWALKGSIFLSQVNVVAVILSKLVLLSCYVV